MKELSTSNLPQAYAPIYGTATVNETMLVIREQVKVRWNAGEGRE